MTLIAQQQKGRGLELFCRKIGPPICWDFLADLGGGVDPAALPPSGKQRWD